MFFFSILKKLTSPANESLLQKVETIGKCKNLKKKLILEINVQVQLMCFHYINVETIEKCKKKKLKNVQVQLMYSFS